jgi:hypothetical protein
MAAFAGGFLVSSPTFLWEGDYQLRSIQFYGTWDDATRAGLSTAENWWLITRFYFDVAQPEVIVAAALFLGLALALWRRDRAVWPVLVGAVVAFVAHPPRMLTFPHHILPWMPFLALLPAYAAAVAFRAAVAARRPVVTAAVLLVVLGGTLAAVGDRLPGYRVDRSCEMVRCQTVAEMTAWLEQNTPPDAHVFLSYDAFNEQTFYNWMEGQAVRVPAWCRHGSRQYLTWWNERPSLRGQSGYLAVARADMRTTDILNSRQAGLGVDPYHEAGFEALQTFAADEPQAITVFHFDFRE